MSVQSSDSIPTRIFRTTGQIVQQSDGGLTRGECRILTEPEIFGKKGTEYMGKPPQNSIHEGSRQPSQKGQTKSAESGWITIYGLPNEINVDQEIAKKFTKYGEIVFIERTSGNATSIEFARRDAAEKAVKENLMPFFIGKYAAFVKMGRAGCIKYESKSEQVLSNVELFQEEEEIIVPEEDITLNERIKRFGKSLLTMIF